MRFFPLWHLISKPFAPTILTANVKLTEVLELEPKRDSYKVTAFSHDCLLWTHLVSKQREGPAACRGAMLLSGLAEGQGCLPHPSHHIQANSEQIVTWIRSLQTFFACCLWGRLYLPITKVMLLENWLEKKHCLWRSQTKQQMGGFSWDLIQKTDIFKTFASYSRWNISHSSHTHMRNCIREQRKGNTNVGKKT